MDCKDVYIMLKNRLVINDNTSKIRVEIHLYQQEINRYIVDDYGKK